MTHHGERHLKGVVGNHAEGHSRITAENYQLTHLVRDAPVLAL